MKRLLLLSTLLIFACSSDDSSNDNDNNDNDCNNDNNNNNTFICDGVPYDSIVYGTQEWTVENACHITYRDGTPIPEVTGDTQWENLTTGAWCYYNNDPTKPRLYNWYAVMGIHDNDENTANKEFAPEGWHVPSDAEWTTLVDYIRNNPNYVDLPLYSTGKAMASTSGWDYLQGSGGEVGNDKCLNNSSGFNAFPEGWRGDIPSYFDGEGKTAVFWSSTEIYNPITSLLDVAIKHQTSWSTRWFASNWNYKSTGFSVRLVKD